MENFRNIAPVKVDKATIINLEKGKLPPQVLDLDTAIETLGEDIVSEDLKTEDWTTPAWQDNEIAAEQLPEVSTNTGNWTFKLEIEDEGKES